MKNLFTFKNPAAFQASVITFVLALFLLLVFFSIKSFAQPSFSPKTDFATATSPFYVATGDINGDGIADLVVANFGAGSVSVFLNTTAANASTPTYSAKTDFTTTSNPCWVVLNDINGDGKLDIIAANIGSNTISVLINTTTPGASTPTYSAKTDFTTGSSPYSVAVADLNGDGKPDMAVANNGGTSVSVLFNTTTTGAATPTFSAKTDFTTGTNPVAVKIGDLNGDGKQDLVVTNSGSGTVSVLLNTTTTGAATPTFSAKTDFGTAGNSFDVSIGDINGDGKPDLLTGNHAPGNATVLLNTTTTGAATPTFSAGTNFAANGNVNTVTMTDLNCDGKPDLVIASGFSSNAVTVYFNLTTPGASTPVFTTKADFTTGLEPEGNAVCDINRDGKPDIITANLSGNSFSVLMNTTTVGVAAPSFSAATVFSVTSTPFDNCTADFNGDGKPDLASSISDNPGTISVFLNTTTPGASAPTFSAKTDFTIGSFPQAMCIADINGDGKPDIVFCGNTGGAASVIINTTAPGATTPSFTAKTDFATDGASGDIWTVDINGDGKPDIVTTNQAFNTIVVLLNITSAGSTTPAFSPKTAFTTGTAPVKLVSADFNGDGKQDIIICDRDANSVSVFLNTTTPGASTPTFTAKTDFSVGSSPTGVTTGDFNGDGKQDFAVTNGLVISVFMSTTAPGASTPTFSAKTDFAITALGYHIITGDFNGDGLQDLAYTNGSGLISIYLNATTPGASTPVFSVRTNFAAGSGYRGICAADFNLDGKKDLAFANQGDNTLRVILSTVNLPAPVELSSFTSSVDKQNVTLSWSTVSEENNRGFEIERNSFGSVWKTVGFVEGHGTTNQINNYAFTEHGMATGHYNYRLKQIDYNGNYVYYDLSSEVIIGIPSKYNLSQNFPNPFNPVSVIGYQLPQSGFVSLKVFDISGREVAQIINETEQAGYYTFTFDAKNLSSGTYFYKLSTDNFSDVKKMVVVK